MTWWKKEQFNRRRPLLEQRAACLRAMRAFFEVQGFTEVETPILQVSPGMEPHIKTFATELSEPFEEGTRTLHLQTSPEFAMKKLLVAGMERIYQIAHCFRNGERSPLHSPEFTMLEWYRVGAGMEALMDDCEGLLRALPIWKSPCDITQPFERITVAEAFRREAGMDLLATIKDPTDPDPDPALLAKEAATLGIRTAADDRWEDIFHRIMMDLIEPKLGQSRPTFLTHYPISLAALARRSPDDARLAERFELYVGGIELANAFAELTDAAEQRRRFTHDAALKKRLHGEEAYLDEDFITALEEGMPESAGIALGVDRLVMLAVGAEAVGEVVWG